jgi:hypothetical protein
LVLRQIPVASHQLDIGKASLRLLDEPAGQVAALAPVVTLYSSVNVDTSRPHGMDGTANVCSVQATCQNDRSG